MGDAGAENTRVAELVRLVDVDDRNVGVDGGTENQWLLGERILDQLASRQPKAVGAAERTRGQERETHGASFEAQGHDRVGVFVDPKPFFANRAGDPGT